jgi:uncharacterized damage-inducible protein DinB
LDPLIQLFKRMRSKTVELLDCVPDELMAAKSPDGRSVAALFAHVHDGLCLWMRSATSRWKREEIGDRAEPSREDLRKALVESCNEVVRLFTEEEGRLMNEDVPPVGTGADLIGYMVAHEAHHHGEIYATLQLHGHTEFHHKLWHQGDEVG